MIFEVFFFMSKIFNIIKIYNLNINTEEILNGLQNHSDFLQYSHRINGRWENQYLDIKYVPEIKIVFQKACQLGKELIKKSLIVPNKSLGLDRDEFWFNSSKPGESTGWHDHKKGSILSAVFYLDVPRKSGDIRFRVKEHGEWIYHRIKSKNNNLILFDSNIEHSVSENKSKNIRISLAFNLFTLPLDIDHQVEDYSAKKFFT